VISDIASGNLRQDPNSETGADRIAALAFADHLGAALWRLTDDLDPHVYPKVVLLLARAIRREKESPKLVRKIAERAVWEYVNDKCPKCMGTGTVTSASGVADACTLCDSTGVRRHTDASRARSTRLSREACAKLAGRFESAIEALAYADSGTARRVIQKLGR
jgi:hypothetical protein